MRLLQMSSTLFLLMGNYLIQKRTDLVGYGVSLVGCTSILYHSTYHSAFKTIDVCSNVILGTYFLLQSTPFVHWFVRICWVSLSIYGHLNTLQSTAEQKPLAHFVCVHTPVLMGFWCIAHE